MYKKRKTKKAKARRTKRRHAPVWSPLHKMEIVIRDRQCGIEFVVFVVPCWCASPECKCKADDLSEFFTRLIQTNRKDEEEL